MYPQVEDWPRLSLGRPGLGPAWAWTHPGLYYITGLLKKSPVVSFVLLELKPKQQRCKYWLFFNQCSSGKFSKIFLAPDNKTANEINRAPVTLKAPGICCKFSRENRKKKSENGKKSSIVSQLVQVLTISVIYKKHVKKIFIERLTST